MKILGKEVAGGERFASRRKRAVSAGLALTIAVIASACGSGGSGQPGDGSASGTPVKLTLAMAGVDPLISIAWVGQAYGIFDKNNLDIKIEVDGANVGNALVAGKADIGIVGPSSALNATNQGKPMTVIYNNAGNASAGVMGAAPDVKAVEDCKRVGVLAGGGPAAWAQTYKNLYRAPFRIVPINDQNAVMSALAGGTVDCAVGSVAAFPPLVKAGKAHYLINLISDPNNPTIPQALRELRSQIMEGSLIGLTDHLESRRKDVTAFLAAYNEAVQKFRSTSPEELARKLKATKDWAGFNEAALATLLSTVAPGIAPNNGHISPDSWKPQLAYLKAAGLSFINEDEKLWSYDSRVDMSYYEKAGIKPGN